MRRIKGRFAAVDQTIPEEEHEEDEEDEEELDGDDAFAAAYMSVRKGQQRREQDAQAEGMEGLEKHDSPAHDRVRQSAAELQKTIEAARVGQGLRQQVDRLEQMAESEARRLFPDEKAFDRMAPITSNSTEVEEVMTEFDDEEDFVNDYGRSEQADVKGGGGSTAA